MATALITSALLALTPLPSHHAIRVSPHLPPRPFVSPLRSSACLHEPLDISLHLAHTPRLALHLAFHTPLSRPPRLLPPPPSPHPHAHPRPTLPSAATSPLLPRRPIPFPPRPTLPSRRLLLAAPALLLVSPRSPAHSLAGATPAPPRAPQRFAVASSPLDRRLYRALRLPNGLHAFLCSDGAEARAAAAVNVHVGSYADPDEWPGLAHFCEHMLFLGSARFPEEGSFERFLSANGGSSNAFTESEDTTYYCDVSGAALDGALERLADLLRAPLLSPSAAAREVNAIDAEHEKNLQSDGWRADAARRRLADPSHPYARFATGNRETLRGGDAAALAALAAFHREHYRAERMCLAVQGPQPLAQLEQLALRHFAELPSCAGAACAGARAAYDRLPPPFAAPPPCVTLLVPQREARRLTFTWSVAIADARAWRAAKPHAVVLLLLAHRGEAGLARYLKAAGLADGVEAGVGELTDSFLLLSCSIDLTLAGFAEWRAVGAAFFSYVRALRSRGVPPHVYADARRMRALLFQYAEPPPPVSLVQSAARAARLYPPAQWLTGPALASDGAPALVPPLLAALRPAAAVVTLAAPEHARLAALRLRWGGGAYAELPAAPLLAAWDAAPPLAPLGPPRRNPYIPRALGLRPAGGGGAPPARLRLERAARLHFAPRGARETPKAVVCLQLRAPRLYATPAAAALAEVYGLLLADELQDVAYEAALGGLACGGGVGWRGLSLSLSGFDEHAPALAALVARAARDLAPRAAAFDARREAVCRGLRNLAAAPAAQLCVQQRSLALQPSRHAAEAMLAAAEAASLDELAAFREAAFERVEVEALVCGNLDGAQAEQIVRGVLAALRAAPPEAPPAVRRARRLPVGSTLRQHVAANAEERSSATEVYVQVGPDEGDEWVLLTLLSQMLAKGFYSELRTRQQLGYIVQCTPTELDGVRGLSFLVQSSSTPPQEVERRIEGFLRLFRGTLLLLPQEELDLYCDTLAAQFASVDGSLELQAARLWQECLIQRYDFERPWANARKVRQLTQPQLLDFFDTYVAAGSPTRRRMATHVFAQSMAPDTLTLQPLGDDFFPPLEDQLADQLADLAAGQV
ncbi:hypothetical protein AB1Y20_007533 [Prymnesium parvum]|uniref:Insulysin n=1 Tax=Prymnesium parvum TaxID=97485 RepID=A0AB34IWD2_PRYPA